MASNKRKSLEFFTYLCQKIGSVDIVKARRLLCTIGDIALDNNFPKISSGSKGEGLNFKDSDTDLMFIEPDFRVYEFESDVTATDKADLIMNKEETPPCFTYLYLLSNHKVYSQLMFLQKDGKVLLSSELFKKRRLRQLIKTKPTFRHTHGPCITDDFEEHDIAYCIRCEKWISQAQPWINRPRTEWPPSDLVSQITSLGVLFVPIGCKGSVNEHFEWRISFSVAEKLLIFSWSHTQLLCYALLKILLKEIIQQIGDLKDLLCSYFIKTLMFWLSEESDPSIWRPDNIIPCFMACLQKLLYSIEYSTLLHYFIPESNLFFSRFNTRSKEKLITLLQNLCHQGIQFFSSSESLRDLSMFSCCVTNSIDRNSKLAEEIIQLFPLNNDRGHIRRLMYNFLQHSKSRLGKHIFSLFLSNAHQFVSQSTDGHHRSNNKQHYNEYKHGLSHLLVGLQSDVLSGWLVLASFFNVHKNYPAALAVINHALSKCTDETITLSNSHTLISDFAFNDKMKEYVTKLIGPDNYIKAVKHLMILMLRIDPNTIAILPELRQDIKHPFTVFPCIPVAHFIRFLCCYHLDDVTSCMDSIDQLLHSISKLVNDDMTVSPKYWFLYIYSMLFLGVAKNMIGDTAFAKDCFQDVARRDVLQKTSASKRLSQLL